MNQSLPPQTQAELETDAMRVGPGTIFGLAQQESERLPHQELFLDELPPRPPSKPQPDNDNAPSRVCPKPPFELHWMGLWPTPDQSPRLEARSHFLKIP